MKQATFKSLRFCIAALPGLLAIAGVLAAQTPAAQTPPAQAPATHASEWVPYRSATDGFSTSFPAAPEVQKQNIDTQAGTFELRSYIVEVNPVAMFVGVCDYGDKMRATDPDTMLQGAKNGALKNSNPHLLREKQITLGIYHGIEFESESDSAHFYARAYMVGGTLYQALVVCPIGSPYADTLRFLDSFQLIARVKS